MVRIYVPLRQDPLMRTIMGVTPISVALRELRQQAGLSQRELGRKAGVRHAAISHIETGKAQRIDLDVLERLCRALRCEPADVLRFSPRARKR